MNNNPWSDTIAWGNLWWQKIQSKNKCASSGASIDSQIGIKWAALVNQSHTTQIEL